MALGVALVVADLLHVSGPLQAYIATEVERVVGDDRFLVVQVVVVVRARLLLEQALHEAARVAAQGQMTAAVPRLGLDSQVGHLRSFSSTALLNQLVITP